MKILVPLSLLFLVPVAQAAPLAENLTVISNGKPTSARLPRTFFVEQVADLTQQIEKSPRSAILYARRARAWSRSPDSLTPNGQIEVSYWPQFKSDLNKARELAPGDVAVLVACLDAVNSALRRATDDERRLKPPVSQQGKAIVPGLETAQTAVSELGALKTALEKEGVAGKSREFARWKMWDLLEKLGRTSMSDMSGVIEEMKAALALSPTDPVVQLVSVSAERHMAVYADIFQKGSVASTKASTEPILEKIMREQPQLAHDTMSRAARYFTRTTPELALEWQTRAAQIGGVTQSADNKFVAWKTNEERQDGGIEEFLYQLDPYLETEWRGYELPELATQLAVFKVGVGQFALAQRAFETAVKWGGKPGLWLEAGDTAYRADNYRAAGEFYETFALLKSDAVSNRWSGGRLAPKPAVYPLRLEVGLMQALAGATPTQQADYIAALGRYDEDVLRLHRTVLDIQARKVPTNATLQTVLKALDTHLKNGAPPTNVAPVRPLNGTDFNADAPFRPNSLMSRYLPPAIIGVGGKDPTFNNVAVPDRDDFLISSFERITSNRVRIAGVRSVQEDWGINLKKGEEAPKVPFGGRWWLLAPSFWAREIKRLDAVIKANPEDTKALADRAAAWSLVYSSDISWSEAQRLERGGRRNQSRVEADLAEIFKRPLSAESIQGVIFARRVQKYGPSPIDVVLKDGAAIRAAGEELQKLDETLAMFAKVSPLVTPQRGYLLGKVTLASLALDDKNEKARAQAEQFLGSARGFIAEAGDKSPMNLWVLAVESARGTLTGDLGAQIRAVGAKMGDPAVASETQVEIARTLWGVEKRDLARTWTTIAVETAGAKPIPEVLWMKVRTTPKITDADLPALRKSAFTLPSYNRDKVTAFLVLADESQKRGQLLWQLRALEEALTYGAPPQTWVNYSRVALTARQWGNAFNANRLALGWQNDDGQAKDFMAEVMGNKTEASPHLQTALRLEGAFAMLKLGRISMAQQEIKDALARAVELAKKTSPDEFVAALEAHSLFLETELEVTPEDEELKKVLDSIADAIRQLKAK